MTSTSTDFKPTVEDFDQWTEKNDEEAFASIAQNYKVRHIIKGDVYWALVPGGRTYKLPLSMSIDDFTRLSNTSDDTESVISIHALRKESDRAAGHFCPLSETQASCLALSISNNTTGTTNNMPKTSSCLSVSF